MNELLVESIHMNGWTGQQINRRGKILKYTLINKR